MAAQEEIDETKKSKFVSRRQLSGYNPNVGRFYFHPAKRSGWLTWQDIPAMLRCPTVQIGLQALTAPLASVQWEIEANSKEIQRYVDSMLQQFWVNDVGRFAEQYYAWGTVPGEVFYREHRGIIEYSGIDEVLHVDTRAKFRGRDVLAFRCSNVASTDTPWIESPRLFWLAHKPPIGNPYGISRLSSAFEPWMEKEGAKGANDARRLWFFKCAFRGGVIWFPPGGSFQDANGNVVDNQDYAREIIEKAESGSVMAAPLIYDENGKEQWRFEPASIAGGAQDLLAYPKQLDEEILYGMGVLPEVVKAAETGGGWSGRSVPLLLHLTAADKDVNTIIGAFDVGIARPAVGAMFGPKARYRIKPVSLVPKAAPQQEGGSAGQPQQAGGNPASLMGATSGQQAPVQMSQAMPEAMEIVVEEGTQGVPVDIDVLDLLLTTPVQMSATTSPKTDSPFRELAEFYARLWNALEAAGEHIPEGEIETVSEELAHSDWLLEHTGEKWTVTQAEGQGGVSLSAAHAPKGGVTVRGKFYRGGQWIPASEMKALEHEDPAKAKEIEQETVQRAERIKGERQNKRQKRGSIDTEQLKGRVAHHAAVPLEGHALHSAKLKFHALARHHGEHTIHRIEELIDQVELARDSLPEDEEGQRDYFSKELAKLHHAIGMAQQRGHTGHVEPVKSEEPLASADVSEPIASSDNPREGDRNADGLVFHDGRWHREESAPKSIGSDVPSGTIAENEIASVEPSREPEPTATGNDGRGTEPSERSGPDGGRIGSGSDRGNDRIRTARPDITRPADTSVIPEGIRQHLNDHQQQGTASAIAGMSTGPKGFILADGTGVGKTRQELAVAKTFADKGHPVLIVSMAEVLKPDWAKGKASGSFADDSASMGIDTHLTKGGVIPNGKIHLTTYNNLKEMAKNISPNTVVIFDEAHALKNWESQRAKAGSDIQGKAHAVLYATATPADHPLDMGYLFRAGVYQGKTRRQFLTDLGMREDKIYNVHLGREISDWNIDPRVGKAEVLRRVGHVFDDMTSQGRMVKREISMEGVTIEFHKISLSEEAHATLDRIDKAFPRKKRALSLMAQRLQQETYKIPAVVQMVKDELAAGRKPVVFMARVNDSDVKHPDTHEVVASSAGTAAALKKALEEAGIADIAELHSGARIAKKGMADFQSSKASVALATIESGGTGINLDDVEGDKPRSLIMMTPAFSALSNMQAYGRVWRLKTKSIPKIINVFGNTPVDEWNAGLISGKMKGLGAIIGGEVNSIDFPEMSDLDEDSMVAAATTFEEYRAKAATPAETTKPTHAPAAPSPAPAAPSPSVQPKPARVEDWAKKNRFIPNKYDTWSNGQKIKAGRGFVRNENGRWVGYTREELEQMQKSTSLSAAHAPSGGVEVDGRHFHGGEFIPADVLAKATPAEKATVMGNAKPNDAASEDVLGMPSKMLHQLAQAGRALGKAEHVVTGLLGSGVKLLPTPIQFAVKGTLGAMYSSYIAAQRAVRAVATERGMTPEQVDATAKLASLADVVCGGKLIPASLHAAGIPAAGIIVGSFVPVGSLGYLAYSTARDPMATLRAAQKAVRNAMSASKEKQPTSLSAALGLDASRLLGELAHRSKGHDADAADWYRACFSTALDAASGNARKALSVADAAAKRPSASLSQADGLTLAEKIQAAADATETEPTDAQKRAGTYRKGKVTLHGLPISIENPRGSTRTGTDKDGKPWSVKMACHYGYIRNTESEADGDHIDVFLGPDPESELIFVIDQIGADGDFDEHKCMLGFRSEAEARQGYLDCYSPGWNGLGAIRAIPLPAFKNWIAEGDTGSTFEHQAVSLSAAHAPKGGITIQGQHFTGGQFITSEVLKQATSSERARLGVGGHKVPVVAEKKGTTIAGLVAHPHARGEGKHDYHFAGEAKFPAAYRDAVTPAWQKIAASAGINADGFLEDVFDSKDDPKEAAETAREDADEAAEAFGQMAETMATVFENHVRARYRGEVKNGDRSHLDDAAKAAQDALYEAAHSFADIFDELADDLDCVDPMDDSDWQETRDSYQVKIDEAKETLSAALKEATDGLHTGMTGYDQSIEDVIDAEDEELRSQAQDHADDLNANYEDEETAAADAIFNNKLLEEQDSPYRVWRNDDGEYEVIDQDEYEEQQSNQGKSLSAAHAPKGGIDIDGDHFKGGEFIKASVMAKATPAEKQKIKKKTAPEKNKIATANKPETASSTKAKREAPGSQMSAEHRNKLRELGMIGTFPPADVPMTDVKMADLAKGPEELKYVPLMSWSQRTKSGRISRQYRYTQEFHDRNAAAKFERVSVIEPHIDKISEALTQQMADLSLPQHRREAAAIASVIRETGLRPTDGEESVKHGHFGISSLQARHLKIIDDEVHLDFIGKEGVRNQTIVRDPANVAFLKETLQRANDEEFIFQKATSDAAGDVLKETSVKVGGPRDILIKDLRTLKATRTAREVVKAFTGPPPPLTGNKSKDVKSIQSAILKMSGEVSKVLNNTPTQARDNYIHPEIFKSWQSRILTAS